MLQEFTFTGEGRQIDARGTFMRYESGTSSSGVAGVAVYADGTNLGTFVPGDAIELPAAVGRWELRPVEGDCAGRVRIGVGRVESTRLVGTVQTIDGGKARSMSGSAFVAYGWQAATAGANPFVQLWNPPASGKRAVINAVLMGAGGVQNGHLRFNQSAINAAAVMSGAMKMSGISAAACDVRVATNAAYTPGTLGTGPNLIVLFGGAGATVQYRPTEPLVLPPGFGIVLAGHAQNVDMGVSFEWFEEAL